MLEKRTSGKSGEAEKANKGKTVLKGLGFLSAGGIGGNTLAVDVKDGKIIRLRPLHYD